VDNATAEAATTANIEFVPMQWAQWGLANLDRNIQRLLDQGLRPTALLGFNEPNMKSQVRCRMQLWQDSMSDMPEAPASLLQLSGRKGRGDPIDNQRRMALRSVLHSAHGSEPATKGQPGTRRAGNFWQRLDSSQAASARFSFCPAP